METPSGELRNLLCDTYIVVKAQDALIGIIGG